MLKPKYNLQQPSNKRQPYFRLVKQTRVNSGLSWLRFSKKKQIKNVAGRVGQQMKS